MNDTQPPAQKQSLPIALIISVCLNMALIGGIAGLWIASTQRPPVEGPPQRFGEARGPLEERIARGALDSLDQNERRAFQRSLALEWRRSREDRSEINAARQALAAAIGSDPYDPEAVSSAFERLRSEEAQLRKRMHDRLSSTLEKLTPEQRATLIERMSNPRRGPRGEGRMRPPPPSPDDRGE